MSTSSDILQDILTAVEGGLTGLDAIKTGLATPGDDATAAADIYAALALASGAATSTTIFPDFTAVLTSLENVVKDGASFEERLQALLQLGPQIQTIISSLGTISLKNGVNAGDFLARLIATAVLESMESSWPFVRALLRSLQFVVPSPALAISFDNIGKFFANPGTYLTQVFGAAALDTTPAARDFADRVLRPLTQIPLPGVRTFYGSDADPDLPPFALWATGDFSVDSSDTSTEQLAVVLNPLTAANGGPAVALRVEGNWSRTFPIDDQLTATLQIAAGDVLDIKLGYPASVTIGTAAPSLKLGIQQTDGASWVLGDPDGVRLELGGMAATFSASADDVGFGATVGASRFVIAASDDDAFLKKVIQEPVTIPFSVELDWTWKGGLRFRGGAGFEIKIPLGLDFGFVALPELDVKVFIGGASPEAGVTVSLTGTVNLKLGPVAAQVQGLGLATTLAFPGKTPNLGFASLTMPRVPMPTGAALSIDCGPVSGGGALLVDPAKYQYAGVGALAIHAGVELALDIVLIIVTKPDVSMLMLATIEFSPGIAIFGGFFLTGLGLLVGVNRRFDTNALRDGVRTGLLESILFPENPLADPATLVGNLERAFPAEEGRYIVGALAKISYGTGVAEIFTAELGLAVQLGGAFVLAVLGQFSLRWPRGSDAEVLVLNLECAGIWDSAARLLSIDASLRDSKVLTWPLSGDAAFRAGPGIFLLSVGGYHPHFHAPPGFPILARLSIAISAGPAQVRFQTYTAITSNTFQIGAMADVLLDLKVCSVSGHLAFDALIQFNPFHFEIDIDASLAIKVAGTTLLGVQVALHLSGPNTWHVAGQIAIEILFFKIKAGFDATFGQPKPAPALPAANPLDLLSTALGLPGAWSAVLPDAVASLVTISGQRPPGTVFVHPLGVFEVRQKIVPLDVEIDKLGPQPVASRTKLAIASASVNGTAVPSPMPIVQDLFAAAQFVDMPDDDKLARPPSSRWTRA